jgi:hypothetical protein
MQLIGLESYAKGLEPLNAGVEKSVLSFKKPTLVAGG